MKRIILALIALSAVSCKTTGSQTRNVDGVGSDGKFYVVRPNSDGQSICLDEMTDTNFNILKEVIGCIAATHETYLQIKKEAPDLVAAAELATPYYGILRQE